MEEPMNSPRRTSESLPSSYQKGAGWSPSVLLIDEEVINDHGQRQRIRFHPSLLLSLISALVLIFVVRSPLSMITSTTNRHSSISMSAVVATLVKDEQPDQPHQDKNGKRRKKPTKIIAVTVNKNYLYSRRHRRHHHEHENEDIKLSSDLNLSNKKKQWKKYVTQASNPSRKNNINNHNKSSLRISSKTSSSVLPSCHKNPRCRRLGLTGDCCPTSSLGVFLDCCESSSTSFQPSISPTHSSSLPQRHAFCSDHPECQALGLTGLCCPTMDNKAVFLDCCRHEKMTLPPTSGPTEGRVGELADVPTVLPLADSIHPRTNNHNPTEIASLSEEPKRAQ